MAEETEEAWDRRNTAQNWEILQVVEDIANSRGASYAQIATAWVSQQPAVASVILGVRTMAQLEDNLAAADITLDVAELAKLNQVSALPDLYPYGFLERYAGR